MKSTPAIVFIILGLSGLLVTGSAAQYAFVVLIISLACIISGIVLIIANTKYKAPPR